MEFQGGGRKDAGKNNGKFQVGVESFDGIPGGTVSENGYPRQGDTDYYWKSPLSKI